MPTARPQRLAVGALAGRRRYPYLFVGWFWYLGMLVPMIGLVQVGDHAMADRYMYIPSIGLCLLVVWGVDALLRWENSEPLPRSG